MCEKRDLVIKVNQEEIGDLLTCVGTALLFATRYGFISQRERFQKVRDFIWDRVRPQLRKNPEK